MRIAKDTADWVRLGLVEGLGPSAMRRLLSTFGLPGKIFSAHRQELSQLVPATVADKILADSQKARVDFSLDWLSRPGHALITLSDNTFPSGLLQCASPPPMLYIVGDPGSLNRNSLAIIGSRNATPQGIANARRFAKAAAEAGLTIVSGLALGIDTAAHQGAIEGGGSTVAVLGCGADIVYPRSNARLADAISRCGAIVSEFALGTPPAAPNFPRRNRIISGLSKGCLIVEAALASGSLITAKHALEQGREVFAIPGSIHSPLSRGCHALIKEGAKLVETAQDIMLELHIDSTSRKHDILQMENPLLQYIGYDPCDIDTLLGRSGLTAAELSAMLLTLELEGKVTCLPGGSYQRLNWGTDSDR